MTIHLQRVISFDPTQVAPYCGQQLAEGNELRSRERGGWECTGCATMLANQPHPRFHIRRTSADDVFAYPEAE